LPGAISDKNKRPFHVNGGGLKIIRDYTKIPSEYRKGFENHKRKVFEPLYFIKDEKTT
jgi:hypothetical protein